MNCDFEATSPQYDYDYDYEIDLFGHIILRNKSQ